MSLFSKARDAVFGKPSSSKSRPVEIPGLFDRATGAGFVDRATGMAGQPLQGQGLFDRIVANQGNSPYQGRIDSYLNTDSPFMSAYQNETLNPTFGTQNPAERDFINSLYSGRQAQFNALGIGDSSASQNSIASAAAPALLDFRQQRLNSYQGGEDMRRGGFTDLLSASGQYDERTNAQINNLLASLRNQLGLRGIDMNALLKSAEFALPQVANSTTQTGGRRGGLDYFNETFGSGGAFGSGGYFGGGGGGGVTA